MKAELELIMLKNDVVTESPEVGCAADCGCDLGCPTDMVQMAE